MATVNELLQKIGKHFGYKVKFGDIDSSIEQLQAENERYKRIAEYGRHKENCNVKPWENKCACGFLQVLKGE